VIATCRTCPQESDDEAVPFRVPWDGHGQALMAEHFADAHGDYGPLRLLQARSPLTGHRMDESILDEPL
jgi:hypothetical protein